MKLFLRSGISSTFTLLWTIAVLAVPQATLSISAFTSIIKSDKPEIYYPHSNKSAPVLLGNDASATGGFRIWGLASSSSTSQLSQISFRSTGRTKLVNVVYDLGGKDVIVTLSQSDSLLRLFDMAFINTELSISGGMRKIWGDFSSWCFWKSAGGQQYFYLFGKKVTTLFLLRERRKVGIEVLEVQSFPVSIEAETCTISQKTAIVFFGGENGIIYTFPASESTSPPVQISKLGEVSDEISGLAIYAGSRTAGDYLFVALANSLAIYSARNFTLLGTAVFSEELALGDIAIYQSALGTPYPDGLIAYAAELDSGEAFGVSSLNNLFATLSLHDNISFDPRKDTCKLCTPSKTFKSCPDVRNCASNGFCTTPKTCDCFSGYTGASCTDISCPNACSSHGFCVSANVCKCASPWGGPDCSFLLVQATYETEENGGDGDDPAIWIAPGGSNNTRNSRIITTTKSKLGAGFGVFDLTGKKLQTVEAGEPNNVDVIYGFRAGNRTVDLVFAACRSDDTLCFFEITLSGTLVPIAGGVQPTTVDNFAVYGSCVYRSPVSGLQYLFINSKTSLYLQFLLTSTPAGALATTLVRSFRAGTGGQVEGCVVDNENSVIFIGEEPYGFWRYNAEPTGPLEGYLVDHAQSGGHLYADVEGITLIHGPTNDTGYILVSCQGLSAYNVYQRAHPHAYVMTFAISAGRVDGVTNTDGIAAVGTALGDVFPRGVVIVHDDANEAPDGTPREEAAFKLVDLGNILGANAVKGLALLNGVDHRWNPRKGL